MVCVGVTLEDVPIDGAATKDHPLANFIIKIRQGFLKLQCLPATPESDEVSPTWVALGKHMHAYVLVSYSFMCILLQVQL